MNTIKTTSKKILAMIMILSFSLKCAEKSDQIKDFNHSQTLIKLASAHILSRSIHVTATLRIADHLIDGPCSINDLASKTKSHPNALYRLLRLLASNGIFHENEDQTFSLTPLAELLTSHHPESLQAWIANHDGDEKRWRSYGNMNYSIQTGKPAFNNLYEQGYFDFIAQDQAMAASFDQGMQNLSEKENLQIATCYNFSSYQTITDIGGGKGGLLVNIIQSNPGVHGILYDLPHVQTSAQSYLSEHNFERNITFQAGSFFNLIPSDSDLYILKRILHDWDDESCIKILSNCKKSMTIKSKLLIIEAIVTQGNDRDFAKDVDLAMLILFGGKERTKTEWIKLLDAANLQLINIHTTPSMLSILEIVVKK